MASVDNYSYIVSDGRLFIYFENASQVASFRTAAHNAGISFDYSDGTEVFDSTYIGCATIPLEKVSLVLHQSLEEI